MNTKSLVLAFTSVVLVPALVACGAADSEADEEASPKIASRSDTLWGCNVKGESVVCTAALPTPSPEAAYACPADDTSARCPSALALSKTAGLKEMLERTGAKERFATITWACLVTGKVQHQCVRDLSALQRAHLNGGGPDGEGAPAESSDSTAPRPDLPSSCEPEAWEPYFAKLATWAYQSNGVDVVFPEEIFDAHGGIGSIASTAVASHAGDLGSCAAGEATMRAEAWIDAVAAGCYMLNMPILAMCQQAADWAPAQGKCTATGSW